MQYYDLDLPSIDDSIYYFYDFANQQIIKSLSKATFSLYTREALLFFSIFNPDDITIKYINNYIVDFGNMSISTKNTRITALRVILKYLFNRGFNNCDINLYNLKNKTKHPKLLSLNCINNLIKTFKYKKLQHSSIWRGRRDYAILLFMYATGMRVSEIIKFKLSDLDNNWIRIDNAKGAKDRYVPIANIAINALHDYIKYIPIHIKRKHEEVFISDNLVPFTRLTFNYYSNKLFGYNPHIFRHTYATHMIQNGCDEYVLMELLGHASLSTTQIYTHIQKSNLKDTMIRYFPNII